MKIGVVGFSHENINHDMARNLLRQSFHELMQKHHHDEPIEIVSGLTNIGVPKIAYQIADEQGWITVGISAEMALHVNCGIYPVNQQIIEGKEFGDESIVFIDYIDYLVRVGGGKQSHREVDMFIEECTRRGIAITDALIEHDL
ncbi:MAG: hypothetical protein KGO49_13880 [Gammaproteobacteria bacterium]|nr:hypothetical protein [Gammaproteobacteria bacterium]